ncbi:DUF3604 domain-containing protein [Alphaproteobacteria bacterium]|nr:DUF3604 domain-containing protein [Alphaproteobacteria bacterium]
MKAIKQKIFGPVNPELVGDNSPSVHSGDDPRLYGSATIEPLDPVEIRSFQTFKLVYTVGHIGLDDTGAIAVAFRWVSDGGYFQITDPKATNYISAECSGAGRINLLTSGEGLRPWTFLVRARLKGAYLSEGETITITFGDTSQGSPGMMIQTFAEGGFEFKVMTDIQATGNFLPLNQQFSVPIVAGPTACWKGVLPTLRRPGENFHFGLKVEDAWGNPTQQAKGRVRLEPSQPVDGLPLEFDYCGNDRSMLFENLTVQEEGLVRIEIFVDGEQVAEAGPLVVQNSALAGFWADLHGQTGETVGINTIEGYFDFAKNKAFLDASAHQGNDFQIKAQFWDHLNQVTAEYNEPGRFTTLPGYEWSGNTAIGGDHNVFFKKEGRAIRRCSHALLEDRSEMASDATTLTDLYAALKEEDAVVYAHVGGRFADITYDHDPDLETAVEVHSAWGTFEWVVTDGFPLGRRVGVVCNSDGHKGRPGASYPGASSFGSYGGLTCFLMDENSRDALFEAQRRRHHYGTTGCRMHLTVDANFSRPAVVFERNPLSQPNCDRTESTRAMMGDIAQTAESEAEISVSVIAHAGIQKVELRNAADVLETIRPYSSKALSNRIRVLWSGAEYKGRDRESFWCGRAQFDRATIEQFEIINLWNPERLFEQRGSNEVVFDTLTTGNFMGFDTWLSNDKEGQIKVVTNHLDVDVSLVDIGYEETIFDIGGLDRKLRLFRLPEQRLDRELSFTRKVKIAEGRDNPIWVCVTTEDGYQAWSSPIYIYN